MLVAADKNMGIVDPPDAGTAGARRHDTIGGCRRCLRRMDTSRPQEQFYTALKMSSIANGGWMAALVRLWVVDSATGGRKTGIVDNKRLGAIRAVLR
jgi:hypothetical protein